jgi:serine/threonine protein kinase
MNSEQAEKLRENNLIAGPQIGKGNYGTVFRCTDVNTHVNYAVKVVDLKHLRMRPNFSLDKLLREVHVMQQLNHINIVRLVNVLETKDYILLIMELVLGVELFDLIMAKKGVSESESKPIFYQLCSALLYMHSKGIIHRDIKPENILMQGSLTPADGLKDGRGPNIKLVDFGLSKVVSIEGSGAKSVVGTPRYIAPEVVELSRGGPETPTYGTAIDCYSAGVLLHVMLGACFPQYTKVDRPGRTADVVVVFKDPRIAGVSDLAKDLISKLMRNDATERMSMAEAVQHPWLAEMFGVDQDGVPEILRKVSQREVISFEQFRSDVLDSIGHQLAIKNDAPPHPSSAAGAVASAPVRPDAALLSNPGPPNNNALPPPSQVAPSAQLMKMPSHASPPVGPPPSANHNHADMSFSAQQQQQQQQNYNDEWSRMNQSHSGEFASPAMQTHSGSSMHDNNSAINQHDPHGQHRDYQSTTATQFQYPANEPAPHGVKRSASKAQMRRAGTMGFVDGSFEGFGQQQHQQHYVVEDTTTGATQVDYPSQVSHYSFLVVFLCLTVWFESPVCACVRVVRS